MTFTKVNQGMKKKKQEVILVKLVRNTSSRKWGSKKIFRAACAGTLTWSALSACGEGGALP